MTRSVIARSVARLLPILCAVAAMVSPVAASAATGPVSAILVDARDGAVLAEQNADQVRRPASLTKMMTLFLVFDALDDGRLKLDGKIRISRHAASQPASHLGLRAGTRIGVDEAIRAIAVVSANDVAVAMAEELGASEARFARLMTEKARKLGLRDTVFQNASGLPGSNMTSARDMAKLSLALLREHGDRYAYFRTPAFRWGGRRVVNHNHLLDSVPGTDGIKTGYTVEAGYNLAASARRGDRRLIAVVLGERTVQARDRRVARMLEDGFAGRADDTPDRE